MKDQSFILFSVMSILKSTCFRDLYIMIRKGTVQFEPKDMVPLSIVSKKKDGSEMHYSVGSVSYDSYTGNLEYSLYDANGHFVPSTNGLRDLSSLRPEEVKHLSDTVFSYKERALHRQKNLQFIYDIMSASGPGDNFEFSEGNKPEVLMSDGKSDKLETLTVNSLFVPEFDGYGESGPNFYVAGFLGNDKGNIMNVPLISLTDTDVSNVATRIVAQNKSFKEGLSKPVEIVKSIKI